MKKITILTFACVALLFSACKKEGVFNPKQKISKIYTSATYSIDGSTTTTDRSLSEAWTWNKNNTLAKIDNYQGNTIAGTDTYTYDNKKRVVRIDGTENYYGFTSTYHIDFKYNGKELSEAAYYDGNDLAVTLKYTHQNGKISKIEATTTEDMMNMEDYLKALHSLLPQQFYASLENSYKKNPSKNNAKGDYDHTTTWVATWDKDNISKIVITEQFGIYGQETITSEYKYDNYNNPYYGFTPGESGEMTGASCYSKNNITQTTTQYQYNDLEGSENGTEIINYTYTYKGKYPVTCSHTGSFQEETYITEYEYK